AEGGEGGGWRAADGPRGGILVCREQPGGPSAGLPESVDRHDHVREEGGGAGGAGARDGGVEPLAYVPQRGAPVRVGRQLRGRGQREAREQVATARGERGELVRARRLDLDQK